jgi:Nif-specific regulatory protein
MIDQNKYSSDQKLEDYTGLISILQAINSTLHVESIHGILLRESLHLCNADQGSIVLVHRDRKEEPKTIIRNGGLQEALIDHFLNTLISGWIGRYKQYLLTDDLSATFGEAQIKLPYNRISSLLAVPLMRENELIGVLSIVSDRPDRRFGEREAHLLTILSDTCAHHIVNARLHEHYYKEAQRLRHEIHDRYSRNGLIGNSGIMNKLFSNIDRVIDTDARVLMEGESGTGKELIARILHYEGPRKDNPFVPIDCGALPVNLLESELFGYSKGAFTGAQQERKGLIEEAHGGTLFLDEITNMPIDVQSKFLRAIQEGEIRPVGSNRIVKVDVRVIAAASVNIRKQIEDGKFREDLFYRLNVVNIILPPLRERREDIPLLAAHFLAISAKKYGKNISGFDTETMECFENYLWPGNIRELENAVERMVVLADAAARKISGEMLPAEIRYQHLSDNTPPGRRETIKTLQTDLDRKTLLDALIKNNWNQSAAARELGVGESTIRYKMNKYGLKNS